VYHTDIQMTSHRKSKSKFDIHTFIKSVLVLQQFAIIIIK